MKFKIPFEKDEGIDVQPYFVSGKELTSNEKIKKQECLDVLCNLIDLQELGYRYQQDKNLITIKKFKDFLLIEISDELKEVQ